VQANAPIFVFAHGAGAPMDSPFMNEVSAGLTARGIRVVRFEFPYMARRRVGEKSGAPDRPAVLEACFRERVLAEGEPSQTFIGGKSLGGRIATHVADDLGVRGVIALGFPFFPPKKAGLGRLTRLTESTTPTLIIQGTRDPFGTEEQLRVLALPPSVTLHFIEDGDHSLEPRKKSGRTHAQNLEAAVEVAAAFMLS